MHNSAIVLWDYRVKILVHKFEDEHDGPVRGVHFHPAHPLFASCGDDFKVKVWSYRERRCLFTLSGHLDYVRSVQFHHEQPWLVTASDDQTVRIWNWQSRECIATLSGHNHYVMCATFHPRDELVASASMDGTVRVWSISGLFKGVQAPSRGMYEGAMRSGGLGGGGGGGDMFGSSDAVVKFELSGHERGVNHVAFHPTLPLIVSSSDDRTIKLWRINETKAWEVDTMRGHFHNVSSTVFHPTQELLVSASEDRTLRLWSRNKRTGLQTWKRESDRFWSVAVHPTRNLFAAGHDGGLLVFKLERERPCFTVTKGVVYYLQDGKLRAYDPASQKDAILGAATRPGASTAQAPCSMSYNASENAVLLQYAAEGGSYELVRLGDGPGAGEQARGLGICPEFVARNRYAVLDTKSGRVVLSSMSNKGTKRVKVPNGTTAMWPAGLLTVLLRCGDRVVLFDLQQQRALGEAPTPPVKYVFWAPDRSGHVALVGKDVLVLLNKHMTQLAVVHETLRIKSGCWTAHGVFVYCTMSHIKYCLRNGDHGIIRTIDEPVYLTAMLGNKLHFIDRAGQNQSVAVDITEMLLKLKLLRGEHADVAKLIASKSADGRSPVVGESVIAYLQKKGASEVALEFVQDDRTRFNLALECGNIDAAHEAAKTLNDKDCWHRLGVAALRQGHNQIVEVAYQRTTDFERLSFLYTVTGNLDKLQRMLKIAEIRGDALSRFHNALYLGDAEERVAVLEQAGQLPLAYLAAKTHGLVEAAERLAERLGPDATPDVPPPAEMLHPPVPVADCPEASWPRVPLTSSPWEALQSERSRFAELEGDVGQAAELGGSSAWDSAPQAAAADDEDDTLPGGDLGDWGGAGFGDEPHAPLEVGASGGAGDGWDTGDAFEGLDAVGGGENAAGGSDYYVPPVARADAATLWPQRSSHVADHAAAGAVESAIELLKTHHGVVKVAPLRPFFEALLQGSRAVLPGVAGVAPLTLPLNRVGADGAPCGLPAPVLEAQTLVDQLRVAYKAVTEGKFIESLRMFRWIIHASMFVTPDSAARSKELAELVARCREYAVGLRMELHRKELAREAGASPAEDVLVRQAELSAFFTHCDLQRLHRVLSLRSAMGATYRVKNYVHAASFARRLLEMNPPADVATNAKKVIRFSEQSPTNAHKLNYDDHTPFSICAISFVAILRNHPKVTCPLCAASYLPEHKGTICPTCEVAEIGLPATSSNE